MRLRSPRRGFTLVELLVVLGIIAVLLGLLLAAVQQTRASSQRTQCANHLRQIGLGLAGYHGAKQVFPPGQSNHNGTDPYLYMSWHTRILPFVEQAALWEQAQQAYAEDSYNFIGPLQRQVLATLVPLYTCPSDPRTLAVADYQGRSVAMTPYLGVEGKNLSSRDGVLFMDSQVRFADITDGTSNTLMVGERPPSADNAYGWWYAGVGQQGEGSADMVLGVREKNLSSKALDCSTGPYHYGPGRVRNMCDTFHFWSLHPGGGAHFLFADGSVHFLSYAADPLMPALATRSGGETVGPPD